MAWVSFNVESEIVRVNLDSFERYDDIWNEILIDWNRQTTVYCQN